MCSSRLPDALLLCLLAFPGRRHSSTMRVGVLPRISGWLIECSHAACELGCFGFIPPPQRRER